MITEQPDTWLITAPNGQSVPVNDGTLSAGGLDVHFIGI